MLPMIMFVTTGLGAFTWFAFHGGWGFALLTWCILLGIVALGMTIDKSRNDV